MSWAGVMGGCHGTPWVQATEGVWVQAMEGVEPPVAALLPLPDVLKDGDDKVSSWSTMLYVNVHGPCPMGPPCARLSIVRDPTSHGGVSGAS